MKTSQLRRIEYWKQKYCRLIRFRLKNRLDEVYDDDIQHHHHIKPKSIYGQNDYIVLLTVFEHCVAHWYLCKYFKYKKDKDSFRKMNRAFLGLFRQCGFELRNVEHCKMFNHRKSMLEQKIDNMLTERLSAKCVQNAAFLVNLSQAFVTMNSYRQSKRETT